MAITVALTAKNGDLGGKKFQFEGRRKIVIGRGNDCDLNLPVGAEFLHVSRHHSVINVAAPDVRVRDQASRNGTMLNGMQIGRPASWHLSALAAAMPFWEYDLRDHDELKIGDTVFAVEITASAPTSRANGVHANCAPQRSAFQRACCGAHGSSAAQGLPAAVGSS